MPTIHFGKRAGRTRGRPEDRATADGQVNISILNEGVDVVAEKQTVDTDGTGGTFDLASAEDVVLAIAFNATIGTMETAIESLSDVTAATVTGSTGGPWVIEFLDGLGPLTLLVPDDTNLTGQTVGTTVVLTLAGVLNVVENVQFVTEGDTNSYTLTFDSQTTAALDETDGAAELETALELLSSITAVTVTGSGTRKDPFNIAFVNPAGAVTVVTRTLGTWSSTVVVANRQVGPGDRE